MIFDVDTIVEELLTNFTDLEFVESATPQYLPLELADDYLFNGDDGDDISFYDDHVVDLRWRGKDYFVLSMEVRSDRIEVSTVNIGPTPVEPYYHYKVILSLQEWKNFLEQEMPKYVEVKVK